MLSSFVGLFMQIGGIQDLFASWQSYGVYDFLLPFLLIFAIIYGVLTYTRIFADNKGLHIIVSIVIGLMAVRFGYFTNFYTELFPRLGIGITVLLVLIILMGLFFGDKTKDLWSWILIIIGIVIAIVILYQSFDVLGWINSYGYSGSTFVAWIITAILLIGVIVVIVIGNNPPDKDSPNIAMVPMWKGGK